MQAQLWLADAQINGNKFEEARETLGKLINYAGKLQDKHNEYVKACLMLSNLAMSYNISSESITEALDWLNKAIEYSPESAEAIANRANILLLY